MADLPKTIKISELPEVSSIKDTDVFIIEDGSVTHKITGANLIAYIKNHGEISDYYVHQSSIDAANGVAPLNASRKIPSGNLSFGTTSGTIYDGAKGKALENSLDAHLLDNDPHGAKAYADTKIANLINGAPTTLDTLGEIATAMANNQTVVEALNTAIGNKVDKVSGKGLSTNDYTTTEKNKLAGIATNANNYTHPTYTAKSSGLYKVTVDGTGHVSAASAATKDDIVAILGYTPSGSTDSNTTYTLTKSGSTITLSGSDGSTTSVTDADTDTNTWRPLGTTADTACAGNDSRLSNSRPASDVYAWAKASTKPSYTYSEVGAAPSSHNQAASTITAGTFGGSVIAPASTAYTTNQLRNTVFTTSDPGANASTSYVNGSIICVYE